jgi:hypothetical protein
MPFVGLGSGAAIVCGPSALVAQTATPLLQTPFLALYPPTLCSNAQFRVGPSLRGSEPVMLWHPSGGGVMPQMSLTAPVGGVLGVTFALGAADVAGCSGKGATTIGIAALNGVAVPAASSLGVSITASPSASFAASVSAGDVLTFALSASPDGFYCDTTWFEIYVMYTAIAPPQAAVALALETPLPFPNPLAPYAGSCGMGPCRVIVDANGNEYLVGTA